MEEDKYYGWKLVSVWAGIVGASWAVALLALYGVLWVLQ